MIKVKIRRIRQLKGMPDARDHYDGMTGEADPTALEDRIVKVYFDDGCEIFFDRDEVSPVVADGS